MSDDKPDIDSIEIFFLASTPDRTTLSKKGLDSMLEFIEDTRQLQARVAELEGENGELRHNLETTMRHYGESQDRVEVLEAAIQHVLNESTGGQLFAWRDGTIYRKAHRVPDISNHRLGLTVEIAEKPVDLSRWI